MVDIDEHNVFKTFNNIFALLYITDLFEYLLSICDQLLTITVWWWLDTWSKLYYSCSNIYYLSLLSLEPMYCLCSSERQTVLKTFQSDLNTHAIDNFRLKGYSTPACLIWWTTGICISVRILAVSDTILQLYNVIFSTSVRFCFCFVFVFLMSISWTFFKVFVG